MLQLKIRSPHPSPDTVTRWRMSCRNLTPVTTSEWPNMLASSSPLKKSTMQMFLSLQLQAASVPVLSRSMRSSVPSLPTDPEYDVFCLPFDTL